MSSESSSPNSHALVPQLILSRLGPPFEPQHRIDRRSGRLRAKEKPAGNPQVSSEPAVVDQRLPSIRETRRFQAPTSALLASSSLRRFERERQERPCGRPSVPLLSAPSLEVALHAVATRLDVSCLVAGAPIATTRKGFGTGVRSAGRPH